MSLKESLIGSSEEDSQEEREEVSHHGPIFRPPRSPGPLILIPPRTYEKLELQEDGRVTTSTCAGCCSRGGMKRTCAVVCVLLLIFVGIFLAWFFWGRTLYIKQVTNNGTLVEDSNNMTSNLQSTSTISSIVASKATTHIKLRTSTSPSTTTTESSTPTRAKQPHTSQPEAHTTKPATTTTTRPTTTTTATTSATTTRSKTTTTTRPITTTTTTQPPPQPKITTRPPTTSNKRPVFTTTRISEASSTNNAVSSTVATAPTSTTALPDFYLTLGEHRCKQVPHCFPHHGYWCLNHGRLLCRPGHDGWLLWLRRANNTVRFDFGRGWDEYAEGFGEPGGNYWAGLDMLHQLTAGGGAMGAEFKLRAELEFWHTDVTDWDEWGRFSVDTAAHNYSLRVENHVRPSLVDNFAQNNHQTFSTRDRDNDHDKKHSCAVKLGGRGGWWYNYCSVSYPTAVMGGPGDSGAPYTRWTRYTGEQPQALKSIRLKLKPK